LRAEKGKEEGAVTSPAAWGGEGGEGPGSLGKAGRG